MGTPASDISETKLWRSSRASSHPRSGLRPWLRCGMSGDVPRVKRRPETRGEYQVLVLPPLPRSLAELVLALAVEAKCVDAALWQIERAP